jgi:hypothetical protein
LTGFASAGGAAASAAVAVVVDAVAAAGAGATGFVSGLLAHDAESIPARLNSTAAPASVRSCRFIQVLLSFPPPPGRGLLD